MSGTICARSRRCRRSARSFRRSLNDFVRPRTHSRLLPLEDLSNMGFFKDLKNKVTGGAAVVSVNVPTAQRGRPANVQVQATAKANGKVSAVYLLVRAVEV